MFKNKEISQEQLINAEIKSQLMKMTADMNIIYTNLSYAVDPDLIDCYIFELNAIQKKYKFLLKQVKEVQPSAEI